MKKLALLLGMVLAGKSFAIPILGIDVSAGLINHKPSGVFQYPVPQGDRIDVKRDLKFEDKSKVFARVRLEHPIPLIPNLYFQYMPMEFSGSNVVNRRIRYGNTTYDINAKLDSKVQLDRFDIGMYYGIPLSGLVSLGTLDPEVGINARIINFEGSITGQVSGQVRTESKSATIPIPMLYGALGINLPMIPISFRGEVRGVSVSKVSYYDWSLEGRVKPVKAFPIYLSAGYRHEQLKIKDIKDIYADVKVKGPFVMLGVDF